MKKILGLLLIGLMGCSQDYIDVDLEPIISQGEETYFPDYIDAESLAISINIREVYNPINMAQKPLIKLELTTDNYFPCYSYDVITSHSINNNELKIKIEGAVKYQDCISARDRATPYIDFAENINQLTLINGKETDQYSINISDEKITIRPVKSSFTKPLFNVLFRIPENSFAFVGGTNTDNSYIYDDFLSILQQNENFEEFEFKGDGRIPFPEASYGHKVNFPSRFFTYNDFEAFENLETTLQNYMLETNTDNSGVVISIYGWNNINYYSWWPYQDETD